MNNLERIDTATDNIGDEVARSNAVSQLANTYIKSCNLLIRAEECEYDIKKKIGKVTDEE